jgi:hypothetical protein
MYLINYHVSMYVNWSNVSTQKQVLTYDFADLVKFRIVALYQIMDIERRFILSNL